MIFDRNEQKAVVALLGAGSMGTAIVRRIAAGRKILLGDISEKALERVGEDFKRCGYDVETMVVNALQQASVEAFAHRAAELGPVMYFIDTAGASPNQASPEHIVNLDMVGTGYAVREIRHKIGQLGLQDRVTMLGNIHDRERLKKIDAAADLFLFPSLYDNAPLVVREAAAMHTPALMLQEATAAEVIKPDVNGFLTPNDLRHHRPLTNYQSPITNHQSPITNNLYGSNVSFDAAADGDARLQSSSA